jgi:hypothetical protein
VRAGGGPASDVALGDGPGTSNPNEADAASRRARGGSARGVGAWTPCAGVDRSGAARSGRRRSFPPCARGGPNPHMDVSSAPLSPPCARGCAECPHEFCAHALLFPARGEWTVGARLVAHLVPLTPRRARGWTEPAGTGVGHALPAARGGGPALVDDEERLEASSRTLGVARPGTLRGWTGTQLPAVRAEVAHPAVRAGWAALAPVVDQGVPSPPARGWTELGDDDVQRSHPPAVHAGVDRLRPKKPR